MSEKNFGTLGTSFQQALLRAIIEEKKYEDLKGRWNAITMQVNNKRILITMLHRLVDGSSKGIHKVKSQLDKSDKVQLAKNHRENLLSELNAYISE